MLTVAVILTVTADAAAAIGRGFKDYSDSLFA